MKNADSSDLAQMLVDKIHRELAIFERMIRINEKVKESVSVSCLICGMKYDVDELRADEGFVTFWTTANPETGTQSLVVAMPGQAHFVFHYLTGVVPEEKEIGFGYELKKQYKESTASSAKMRI